jgi:acetyl esterase
LFRALLVVNFQLRARRIAPLLPCFDLGVVTVPKDFSRRLSVDGAQLAGPAIRGMACLYPTADLRNERGYPLAAEHDGKIIKMPEFATMRDLYIPDAQDRGQPYASPGLAPDLTGLPPSLILTCECAPLNDPGQMFAERLHSAGNVVSVVRLDGMIHGVISGWPPCHRPPI